MRSAGKIKNRQLTNQSDDGGSAHLGELNPNQRVFCREYARHGNATLAYHTAYPDAGYDTCRNAGARLIAKDCILDFVQICREELQQRLNINRDDILRVLASIAFNPSHKHQLEALHELWEKLGFEDAKPTRDRRAFLATLSGLGSKLGRSG